MSKLFKSETKTGPAHIVRHADLKLTKKAKQAISMQGYTPREKDENEAPKSTINPFERGTYKVGDGDHNVYVPRPGSLVAFTLPSRGIA